MPGRFTGRKASAGVPARAASTALVQPLWISTSAAASQGTTVPSCTTWTFGSPRAASAQVSWFSEGWGRITSECGARARASPGRSFRKASSSSALCPSRRSFSARAFSAGTQSATLNRVWLATKWFTSAKLVLKSAKRPNRSRIPATSGAK